jgi:hypothetical protein
MIIQQGLAAAAAGGGTSLWSELEELKMELNLSPNHR